MKKILININGAIGCMIIPDEACETNDKCVAFAEHGLEIDPLSCGGLEFHNSIKNEINLMRNKQS